MPIVFTDGRYGLTLMEKDMAESSFLRHYRVGGEKKGVRRWQYKNGKLTPEGYIHYKEMYGWGEKQNKHSFDDAETKVRKSLSNEYNQVRKTPIDHRSVKKRSGLSDEDARKCEKLAEDAYQKASQSEPKITADVTSIVRGTGAKMYGLDNRLKQPTSIAGKIGSEFIEKGTPFEDAAKDLKDLIRYTAVSDENRFVDNYNKIKSGLESSGYSEVRCRNFFDRYANGKAQHKSVQSVFSDKNGNTFEMQFQTVASQAAKELKTPLYERRRSAGISDSEKQDLEKKMRDLAEQVGIPKDVSTIKEHDE